MLRVTTLAALLAAALLLSACTTSDGATGGPDEPADPATTTGCGECVEELAAVREDIEASPDVSGLRTLETYRADHGAGVGSSSAPGRPRRGSSTRWARPWRAGSPRSTRL